MISYKLPENLEAIGSMLHPLALKEKWGLTYEQLSRATQMDEMTLKRYALPDHASTARRPWRNKTILRLSSILDLHWETTGCPYVT